MAWTGIGRGVVRVADDVASRSAPAPPPVTAPQPDIDDLLGIKRHQRQAAVRNAIGRRGRIRPPIGTRMLDFGVGPTIPFDEPPPALGMQTFARPERIGRSIFPTVEDSGGGSVFGSIGRGAARLGRRAGGGVLDVGRRYGGAALDAPLIPFQNELTLRDVVQPAYEAARVDIPGRERLVDVMGEMAAAPSRWLDVAIAAGDPRRALRSAQEDEGGGLPALAEEAREITETESPTTRTLESIGRGAAEVVFPMEVWEIAIEFVPFFGTVPDLMRAYRLGAPDAIAAVERAMQSPRLARVRRLLQSERGALEMPPRPQQGRFTDEGETVFEDVLEGDRGAQGDLFRPTESGESLAVDDTPLARAVAEREPEPPRKPARFAKDDPPWTMPEDTYRSLHGAPRPMMGELGPDDLRRMSQQAKDRHYRDWKARSEASAAKGREYDQKLLEAYDSGQITLDSPELHPDARNTLRLVLGARRREQTVTDVTERMLRNNIGSIDDVEIGDRVFSIMRRKYGTVTHKFKRSIRIDYGEGKAGTEDIRQLQWLAYDDAQARALAGEPIHPRDEPTGAFDPEEQRRRILDKASEQRIRGNYGGAERLEKQADELRPPAAPAESRPRFVLARETRQGLAQNYVDENGVKIASSRTTPAAPDNLPLRTWRIDDFTGAYGPPIEELRQVPTELIDPGEITEADRMADAARYTEWLREGKEPPPASLIKKPDGRYLIIDGHRRYYAAREAGRPLRAWVSDSVPIPGKFDTEGKPIHTGMTTNLAKYYGIGPWEGRPNPNVRIEPSGVTGKAREAPPAAAPGPEAPRVEEPPAAGKERAFATEQDAARAGATTEPPAPTRIEEAIERVEEARVAIETNPLARVINEGDYRFGVTKRRPPKGTFASRAPTDQFGREKYATVDVDQVKLGRAGDPRVEQSVKDLRERGVFVEKRGGTYWRDVEDWEEYLDEHGELFEEDLRALGVAPEEISERRLTEFNNYFRHKRELAEAEKAIENLGAGDAVPYFERELDAAERATIDLQGADAPNDDLAAAFDHLEDMERVLNDVRALPPDAPLPESARAWLGLPQSGTMQPSGRAAEEATAPIAGGVREAEEVGPGMARAEEAPEPEPWTEPGATEPTPTEPEAVAPEPPVEEPPAPPPTPPAPPPTAAAPPPPPPKNLPPASTPPKKSGLKFIAPLRPFDEVRADVKTSRNAIARALVGHTGINPSILDDSPVGTALTAYARQEIAVDELTQTAVTAAIDVHAQRFTARRGHLFSIAGDGTVRNAKAPAGKSRIWQDVFSRPGDYELTDAQRAYIDDYHQVIDEAEQMRVDAGLEPRAKSAKEDGWFYVPRQVKGIRGIEIRRPSSPKMQRLYEEAQEGVAKGIRYDTDPRATLELHVRNAYREVLDKQLSDALEPLSIVPRDLVSAPLRIEAEKVGSRMAAAQNAILALQRAKRGEQIPTSTIEQIERAFPQLEGRIREATEITLEDLLKMSKRAKERGIMRFKPVSPGHLKELRQEVDELEAAVARGATKLEPKLRKKRAEWGWAKFRFAQEQELRDQMAWTYADHVENEKAWLEMERSTRTLIRENTRLGKAEQVTQRQLLDELIKEIRGEPYTVKTSSGHAATRYKGGLLDDVRQEIVQVRQRYTGERARAQRAEVARSDVKKYRREDPTDPRSQMVTSQPFWGPDQPDEIAVAQWRNRIFRREDAELLTEKLGAFRKPKQERSWIGSAFEHLGNHIRFLSSVGDFAAPFIHGLPMLGRPGVWSTAALRHYQAFVDPTVQARLVREYLPEFQEMARQGTPIGDPEMFAAIREGQGLSAGQILEAFPKGEEVRGVLQQGGRQAFGRFQSSYNVFLGAGRAKLTRALQHSIKDTAERQQTIRNMTGGLDTRALGVSPTRRGIESTWLAFSPRLLRSTLALLRDAARGPLDPVGREALRSLGGLASAATLVYITTGLAMGKDWDEIKGGLNPLAGKRFLSHEVNGDYIGVGGQVRAIMQFMTAAIVDPKSLASWDRFDNPLIAFVAGRGAPGVNIATIGIEGLSGGEFNANPYVEVDGPIDIFPHLATSAVPFAAQAALEGQKPLTILASMLGARTSPPSRTDRARQAIQDAGGDFRAAHEAALAEGDTELAKSITYRWRDDFKKRAKEQGLIVIPGKKDPPRAPRVELQEWNDRWDDYGGFMADALGLKRADNLAGLRAQFVERWLADYMQDKDVGESEARDELSALFDKHRMVKSYLKAEKQFRLNYWRQHPELLDEAQILGIERLNDDEEKILDRAKRERARR